MVRLGAHPNDPNPASGDPGTRAGKAAWRSLLEGSADAHRMAVSSDPDLDFDRLGAAADLKIGLRVPVAQCNSTPAASAADFTRSRARRPVRSSSIDANWHVCDLVQ